MTPIKNRHNDNILLPVTFAALYNKYPTSKLNNAHTIFTVDDERPLPGGFEKGVGNLFPEMPFTKCGTALVKNIPAKKAATY